MSNKSSKGSLPYGWIVKTSRHYPDRIYYFNINTGVSTWECPELDPPRIISKEEENEEEENEEEEEEDKTARKHIVLKESESNKYVEKCSKPKDDMQKSSAPPPTAVVVPVPVVNTQNELNTSTPLSKSKKKRLKRKSRCLEENSDLNEISPPGAKKKKNMSPLNMSHSKESVPHDIKEAIKTPFIDIPEEVSKDASSASSPSNESIVKDIEMRDVSVDILDDLTEKKETVFDTSACYYIVVDTNVLIRELNLISELKDTPLDGCGPPHIFIPWIVIEELDKLKGQRIKVGACASEAIRYLNSVLGKHPRFHGQSPAEAEAWAKTYSKCNDDKILECCMALCDKMPAEKVILLTNDKNLVNKALILNINVHDFESMMKKVKPDTKFNYGEMKPGKRKKKDTVVERTTNEVVKSPSVSQDTAEERALQTKRDSCRCAIHSIMSNARLLLKDILLKFFAIEMLEAYGNAWSKFPIATNLLKGLLEGILKYWRTVFFEFFNEKDKRNIELLLEKASRPEGFLGDKEECLVILSAVEDIFRQVQKRQPKLDVPVEKVQDYRVACVNAFSMYTEAEGSFRAAEEKSIQALLDDNWTIINQLCGIIMDHYNITHQFDYIENDKRYSNFEIQRIMVILYPAVEEIKNLLCKILLAVKNCQPVKTYTKRLATALLEFIPSLRLPYEPTSYPFFSNKALEKWFANPQNRQKLELGIKQIELFFSKLEEALLVILRPSLINSPEHEMICD